MKQPEFLEIERAKRLLKKHGYSVTKAEEPVVCECSHCGCRYKETEQTPEDYCSVECENADK